MKGVHDRQAYSWMNGIQEVVGSIPIGSTKASASFHLGSRRFLFLGWLGSSDSEADLQDVGSAARGQESEAAMDGQDNKVLTDIY